MTVIPAGHTLGDRPDPNLLNTATGGGGGIYDAGTLEVTNSTIAATTATDLGGGIRTTLTVSLTNASVAANSAGSGGSGIFVDGAIAHLVSTIISNNVSDTDCAVDGGTVTGNNNLIRARLIVEYYVP